MYNQFRSGIQVQKLCKLYISAWVFTCKFAAYFPNTFSKKHFWVAAFGYLRDVFRIPSKIHDGAFLQKYLTNFSR